MKHTDIIKAIKAVTPANQTKAVLKYLEVGNGELFATDLESIVIVKNELFSGETTIVESKQFTDVFTKSLDGLNRVNGNIAFGQVTLNTTDDDLVHPTLKSLTQGCKFETWFSTSSQTLVNALQGCDKFMGKHDVRYYLNGACMSSTGGFKVTASDGHRLLHRSSDKIVAIFETSVIVPRDTIKLIASLKSDDNVLVELGSIDGEYTWIVFDFDNVSIYCKLIDARYPDFGKVLQQYFESVHIDDVASIAKTIKGIKPLVKEAIKLVFNDTKTNVTDALGNSLCTLPITVMTECDFIGLNYKYLVDLLSVVKVESATLKVPSDGRCLVLNTGDTQLVQMSMVL